MWKQWHWEDILHPLCPGANGSRYFHNVSPAKAFELCSAFPWGTMTQIQRKDLVPSSLIFTMGPGKPPFLQIPRPTVVISSNITPVDQQWLIQQLADIFNRYASRCLTLEFKMGIISYMDLAQLWRSCSACAGFCIELGSRFFESGLCGCQ